MIRMKEQRVGSPFGYDESHDELKRENDDWHRDKWFDEDRTGGRDEVRVLVQDLPV